MANAGMLILIFCIKKNKFEVFFIILSHIKVIDRNNLFFWDFKIFFGFKFLNPVYLRNILNQTKVIKKNGSFRLSNHLNF